MVELLGELIKLIPVKCSEYCLTQSKYDKNDDLYWEIPKRSLYLLCVRNGSLLC